MHAEFKPFVVESHGFIAPAACSVISDLASYASDVLHFSSAEMAGYLKRRVAIAIQRGNAALDRTGIQSSRNSFGAALALGMVNARLSTHSSKRKPHPRSIANRSLSARPHSARSHSDRSHSARRAADS